MKVSNKHIELVKALSELKRREELSPIDFFKPFPYQKALWGCDKKNIALIAGNQSGKTINGAAYVIRHCLDNPESFVLCITRASMTVEVQQSMINKLLPRDGRVTYAYFNPRGFVNRLVMFSNGSKIIFRTYDAEQMAIQGFTCTMIWADEELLDNEQTILDEIRMRLIAKNGILLRTFTPINCGIGSNIYTEMVTNYNDSKAVFQWSTTDNPLLPQEAIDNMYLNYDEKTAKQRMNGTFINLNEGLVYEAFSLDNIVKRSPNGMELIPNFPIEVSCDFNVKLMNWSISQDINGIIYVSDFIEAKDTANTQYMCDMLKRKYPGKKFIFYVDEAGSQKHTNTSKTDHDIIRSCFPTSTVCYRHIDSIKDRFCATNARLKNAKGQICLYINEKCKTLIQDFQKVNYDHFNKRGTQGELTHASDAISYQCFYKYKASKYQPTITRPLK